MTRRDAALMSALAGAVAFAGCREEPSTITWVLRAGSAEIDLRRARWEPAGAVRTARRIGGARLELELRPGFRGDVRVETEGACSVSATFDRPDVRTTDVAARVVLPEWVAGAGYDRDVEIVATSGCAEAALPSIEWHVTSGASPLDVTDDGHRVRVHTPSLQAVLATAGASLPSWGIVPISPRTQGRITLEARFAVGSASATRTVEVVAGSRATGVPTVAAGGPLYLFGEGWTAQPDVHGRAPALSSTGGFTQVDTRTPGRFVLVDSASRRLGVRFGRYDEMPLDCSRAECHRDVGQTIEASAMTHVFERGLVGALGDDYRPACAVACHALGEPGQDDGGFVHLARIFSARLPAAPDADWFAEMPRALRRTSGVGCMACHGPAAIPESDARWSILRASVCATCHDAPPKYGHVAAWQSSAMATSDRTPETRVGECAACHTTAGFLAAIGARKAIAIPAEAGALGISCAACHSPHAKDSGVSLVRVVAIQGDFGGKPLGSSVVCVACHGGRAVASKSDLPRATAALLALAPGPHATDRGCLACHGAPRDPKASVHGAGHAFKANPASCRPCHTDTPKEHVDAGSQTIAHRANALFESLLRRGLVVAAGGVTPHSGTSYAIATTADAALAEAVRKVALVRDDRAAASHNAARARALLDEAERALR